MGQIRDSARSLATEGKTEEAVDLLVSALDAVLRKSRELELMVLKLQRERVGKRSERVDPGQLQLMFEQLMSEQVDGAEEPELDPEEEAREDAQLQRQIEEAKKQGKRTRVSNLGEKPSEPPGSNASFTSDNYWRRSRAALSVAGSRSRSAKMSAGD